MFWMDPKFQGQKSQILSYVNINLPINTKITNKTKVLGTGLVLHPYLTLKSPNYPGKGMLTS